MVERKARALNNKILIVLVVLILIFIGLYFILSHSTKSVEGQEQNIWIKNGEKFYGASIKSINKNFVVVEVAYEPGPPCPALSPSNYTVGFGDTIPIEDGVSATLVRINGDSVEFIVKTSPTICV